MRKRKRPPLSREASVQLRDTRAAFFSRQRKPRSSCRLRQPVDDRLTREAFFQPPIGVVVRNRRHLFRHYDIRAAHIYPDLR
jgi:hypothetical protein